MPQSEVRPTSTAQERCSVPPSSREKRATRLQIRFRLSNQRVYQLLRLTFSNEDLPTIVRHRRKSRKRRLLCQPILRFCRSSRRCLTWSRSPFLLPKERRRQQGLRPWITQQRLERCKGQYDRDRHLCQRRRRQELRPILPTSPTSATEQPRQSHKQNHGRPRQNVPSYRSDQLLQPSLLNSRRRRKRYSRESKRGLRLLYELPIRWRVKRQGSSRHQNGLQARRGHFRGRQSTQRQRYHPIHPMQPTFLQPPRHVNQRTYQVLPNKQLPTKDKCRAIQGRSSNRASLPHQARLPAYQLRLCPHRLQTELPLSLSSQRVYPWKRQQYQHMPRRENRYQGEYGYQAKLRAKVWIQGPSKVLQLNKVLCPVCQRSQVSLQGLRRCSFSMCRQYTQPLRRSRPEPSTKVQHPILWHIRDACLQNKDRCRQYLRIRSRCRTGLRLEVYVRQA